MKKKIEIGNVLAFLVVVCMNLTGLYIIYDAGAIGWPIGVVFGLAINAMSIALFMDFAASRPLDIPSDPHPEHTMD